MPIYDHGDSLMIGCAGQAVLGPNVILMMSFVGWEVWGISGTFAIALATFGLPCVIYFAAYRLWDRFRGAQ
jgi:chromate transport protein ChrA